jgi:hypothetical protein
MRCWGVVRVGVAPLYVSNALGHANTRTTEAYLAGSITTLGRCIPPQGSAPKRYFATVSHVLPPPPTPQSSPPSPPQIPLTC